MDDHEDDAPPPYSAIDPNQLQETDHDTFSSSDEIHRSGVDSLESNLSSLHIHATSPVPSATPAESTTTSVTEPHFVSEQPGFTSPPPFGSAASYFAERSPPISVTDDVKLDILFHHMTIYARSQGKDFPRRPRCWNSRASEINQHDWDAFLNFLFPSHLDPAATSNRLHRRVRAEIERDRKDRAQETDDERSARIDKVITDWNEQFLGPRGARITWTYVADLEEGPPSSLCPNCYPQASGIPRARGRLTRQASSEAPIPVAAEEPTRRHIQRRPVPQTRQAPISPQTPDADPTMPSTTVSAASRQGGNYPSMPYGDSNQSAAFRKANPMVWASQMSSQMSSIAQLYAAKITNQAQEYGRAIEETALARSKQAEMYSKKVEENALARGRAIETLALVQGRNIENASDRIAKWATTMGKRGMNVYPTNWPNGPPTRDTTSDRVPDTSNRERRPRRLSTASNTSVSSVSSIDTVSSVSDLDPEDLASIRAQLTSLDEYHSHELYDAAVSLRNQLHVMKKSRANLRGQPQRARPWGRWESPEEATKREQRRVGLKKESKLLQEKFTEIERRARREVRELRKAKREARKKQWRGRLQQSSSSLSVPSQQNRAVPERTVSDMNPDITKECLVQDPPESFHRTISEPTQLASSGSNAPVQSTSNTSLATTAAIRNPHEAAKAWTEAQRTRVKEIQKANKERLKQIHKEHKEFEKQQRKALKKKSKQPLTLQPGLSPSFIAATPSHTGYSESGTIGTNNSRSEIEHFDDDNVATHTFSRQDSGNGRRGVHDQQMNRSGVTDPETPELDGLPIEKLD